jgi:Mrp family chromosome partitioning ATPase
MTPMRAAPNAVVAHTPEPAPAAEMRRSARLSRNQVIIVIVCALLTGALAGALAAVNPPVYNTTRSIIVVSGANPTDNEVLNRALEALVGSKGLAAEVKRRGDLPQSIDAISGMISTKRSPESPYMDIIVTNPDKEVSEQVSAQVIPALYGVFNTAQVDLPAEQRIQGPIFQEVFPKPLQNTSSFPVWFAVLFGALLGALVPFLIFVVRNLRKPVVESAQDITDAIDLPILAKVPALGARGANPQDSVSGVVTAVERLSLNEPVHRLVLVGSGSGRERAELALALSCTIARSFGQPVALIDADLDDAVLTTLLRTNDVAGVAECLAGQLDPEGALLSVNEHQLPPALDSLRAPDGMVRFLPAGVDTSRNMLRMRSSFHRVLEGLAGRYVIVVNGPRLPGPVPTSQLLSLADATLMVVTEGETGLNDARSAGDTLRSFGTGASGVIVLRR